MSVSAFGGETVRADTLQLALRGASLEAIESSFDVTVYRWKCGCVAARRIRSGTCVATLCEEHCVTYRRGTIHGVINLHR